MEERTHEPHGQNHACQLYGFNCVSETIQYSSTNFIGKVSNRVQQSAIICCFITKEYLQTNCQ